MSNALLRNRAGEPADVCLIVEGCYPHVAGGVSTWLDWLMRSCPGTRFSVVSIAMSADDRTPRYAFPDNLESLTEIILDDTSAGAGRGKALPDATELSGLIVSFVQTGSLDRLAGIDRLINDPQRPVSLKALMDSAFAWQLCVGAYRALMPQASFKDFFWAWQALMGGLFAVMKAPIPPARTYHAISTGYAGLLAARAAIEGGTQVMLTEHGIYTNERQIEILMARWITDTVDKGLSFDDPRLDLRDLWITTFRAYARACYEGCDHITTLFGDNQAMQRMLGADDARMRIIPNGIDIDRFGAIPPAPEDPPTVSLVGRIVPIKDIKTFIRAADQIRAQIPNVRILVAGPTDEDPAYAAECRDLVAELGLGETVTFTGRVNVTDLLAESHVVVLTSLSEAQPLAVLEAGAAGRPCVTTNVGACREMLEGPEENGDFPQRGGFIADLLADDQIAAHIVALLSDGALRERLGNNLKQRVRELYTSEKAAAEYQGLYDSADRRNETGRARSWRA